MKTPRFGLFLTDFREQVTFERSQTLASSKARKAFTIPKGDYEFLFDIPVLDARYDTHLPARSTSTMPIEWRSRLSAGCGQTWLYLGRLGCTNIPTRRSMAVTNIFNQDTGYYFSIPDALVPYGSTFPVECWFTAEETAVSAVTASVLEKHDLCFPATAAEAARFDTNFITSNITHVVYKERHECTRPRKPGLQQISVPVSLLVEEGACTQSFSSKNIIITHVLVIEAECTKEDEEMVNMITENIPLHIYMKPDDDRDNVPYDLRAPTDSEKGDSFPPTYGVHQLDRLLTVVGDVREDEIEPSRDNPPPNVLDTVRKN
ncbi:uncharacterized protein DSM5745_04982 [Aspergillus mulundensis]|uniref:Arrestin C-terminal-like domain-containing protein n=1 Tax=Aspergillus mulundensis TaxID=1810919 RepID=A0A3D8S550_9EURO|nr:hypothetical protein DSM5745_04982 [Aspergillus mulundensis]RDW81425.1 hypothetical protein DSM5745_04982 [Aspergillus mulundensis]